MCKILSISNFSELVKKSNLQPLEILRHCKENVTKYNTDGFGFGLSSDNEIYHYKQVDTDAPISSKKVNYNTDIFNIDTIGIKTNIKKINNSFLMKSDIAVFHGRTSTNLDGIDYCHPYTSENNCLVHNGVIDLDHGAYDEVADLLKTENDTEQLFHMWEKHGLESISELFGYYAFYNIKKTKKGNILEIVKDDTASQFGVKIDSVYIFATSDEMLESFLKKIGLAEFIPYIVEMNSDVYFQVDKKGNISDFVKIESNSEYFNLSEKQKRAFKDYKGPSEFKDYKFKDSLSETDRDYLSTEFSEMMAAELKDDKKVS